MNNNELLKLMESVGLNAKFICSNHNDNCECHRMYDEAA